MADALTPTIAERHHHARRAHTHTHIAGAELRRFIKASLGPDPEPLSGHIVGHLIDSLKLAIELVDPNLARHRALHAALDHEAGRV